MPEKQPVDLPWAARSTLGSGPQLSHRGNTMSELDRTILERHSIRKFLPRPVPRELVDEALTLAGYPEVVRAELNIPPELTIICGLAVGYPDPDFPTNKLHIGRDPVAKHVSFLDL